MSELAHSKTPETPKSSSNPTESQSAYLNINKHIGSLKEPNPSKTSQTAPSAPKRIRFFDKATADLHLKDFTSKTWSHPAGVDKLVLTTRDFSLQTGVKFTTTFHQQKPANSDLSFYETVIKGKVNEEWNDYKGNFRESKRDQIVKGVEQRILVNKIFADEGFDSIEIDFDDAVECGLRSVTPTAGNVPIFSQPQILQTTLGEQYFGRTMYANDPDGRYQVDITRFKDNAQCRVIFNPSKFLGKHFAELASSLEVADALSKLETILFDDLSLRIDLKSASISRIDFTRDREMDHHVFRYDRAFSLFKLRRATKFTQYAGGFSCKNKQREFVFYDKAVEHFKGKVNSSQYLRGEYRLMNTKTVGRFGLGSISDLLSYGSDGVDELYKNLIKSDILSSVDQVPTDMLLNFIDLDALLHSLKGEGGKRRNVVLSALNHFGVELLFSLYSSNQLKSILLNHFERKHSNQVVAELESMLKRVQNQNKFSVISCYHEIRDKFAA